METVKRRRLSHKQKGFVRDIVVGMPGVHAALKNYDTTDYKTASVIAAENLAKPSITEAITEELENYGLTEELIKAALVDDIKSKPKRRIKELELGADLLKLREPSKLNANMSIQINVLNFGNNDTAPVQTATVPTESIGSD